MTRFRFLLAATVVAAIVAVAPVANAQTTHFVAAGSSAQWQMAGLAADQLAVNENASAYSGLGYSVFHWTGSNNGFVQDTRDSRIQPEVGNPWIVWIGDSSGNLYDLWIGLSVDSTVGVRTFSIQESTGAGGQVYLLNTVTTSTAGAAKIQQTLWPDQVLYGNTNKGGDTDLTTAVINAIGEGPAVNPPTTVGLHVTVGMTDIRPEDALFATNRAIAALNTTTYAGLGYVGVDKYIGAPILTAQGTGTEATPIQFALQTVADPISKIDVPAYITVPIGAAPIVFITNNGGTGSIFNLTSGVDPDNKEGGPYLAEQFFGGKVACDTHAAAFGGPGDGAGTALTVLLREPLSGTMNTTEFNVFRTFGNADGSQETGVINPLNSPYNPLNLGCPTHGKRQRAIGTGEVVNALLADANSIGYIFYGFANASKLTPTADFNYLTIDGVDPIGLGAAGQTLPTCGQSTQPSCPASLWTSSNSFPHVRDGSYKAWSMYRWLVYTSDYNTSDPYGIASVAQTAQNYVDADVADFVPFQACPLSDEFCSSSSPVDGMSVYRSHFTPTGVKLPASTPLNNGSKTAANTFNGGNTLGGGAEAGGDVGGLIEGPFGITTPNTFGYVEWETTSVVKGGVTVTEVLHKTGADFKAGASWVGQTITINGTAQVVQGCPVSGVNKCAPTATTLYVANPNPGTELVLVPYSIEESHAWPAATTPGVLSKKQ